MLQFLTVNFNLPTLIGAAAPAGCSGAAIRPGVPAAAEDAPAAVPAGAAARDVPAAAVTATPKR